MRRDWSDAEAKRGDYCRRCAKPGKIELAHVVGRSRDTFLRKDGKGSEVWVNPDSVVGLCVGCHRDYDAGRLDLLPILTLDEQVQAVRDAGGIEAARRRIIGSEAWR